MSKPNAFISNGTCYYGPHQESPDHMLPCGNAALGSKACCQAGDMCRDGDICHNKALDLTYMAGCSDPEFKGAGCNVIKAWESDRTSPSIHPPSPLALLLPSPTSYSATGSVHRAKRNAKTG